MALSDDLSWRGFVHQTTYSDLKFLDNNKVSFYHGFDASADSQTVGNLAGMMLDRLFIRYGHRAIILAGGATSLIGDPGGKDAERPMQDEKVVAANVANAEQQLRQIFSGLDFKLVNNLDWTKDITVIEFLRDIGKHFSMTTLVQRDYIARRLGEGGSGISFAEFSYTLLQGMDYLHLFDTEGVTLQLGSSDQWGNCLSGVELIRKVRGKEVHALTTPLIINKATGKKFGKSEEGAIWLDPQKTTPTQFYQFWINTDDADVEDYLKVFTLIPKEQIEQVIGEHKSDPAQRKAQKMLAEEVTKLVHGSAQSGAATGVTKYLTSQVSIADASEEELDMIRKEIPHTRVSDGASLIEVLVNTGLANSNSEARRLMTSKAIYINGSAESPEFLDSGDFDNGRLLLRRGKAYKDSALIELE